MMDVNQRGFGAFGRQQELLEKQKVNTSGYRASLFHMERRQKTGEQMIQFDDQLSASQLSVREREVLELVACGMSAKQIALQVGIAPRTVERHIENVRNKLRARNKTHMIAKAVGFGLLHIDPQRLTPQTAAPRRFKPKLVANE